MERIQEKLNEVFCDVFEDDDLVITPQLTADEVEDWDSLMHVNLMVAVEKRFGIRFSSGEIARLQNVGELIALIHKKT